MIGVVILIATVIIQAVNWFTADNRSLLGDVRGLIEYENVDTFELPLPADTLGAQLYQAGQYTLSTNAFPAQTWALVYVRDDWRFVEINYLPGRTLEEHKAIHQNTRQRDVNTEGLQAVLIELDKSPRCIDYEDAVPNRCEFSRQLAFELGETLITISADGENATNGELILLAQSITQSK